eukprot:SM000055S18314  [mRNA]  locus=s55:738807:745644:- [translate_table: standard]
MAPARPTAAAAAAAAAVAVLLALPAAAAAASVATANASFDHRALLVGGERRILIAGVVHYARSTPQARPPSTSRQRVPQLDKRPLMWPRLFARARAGSINAIQTYMFWNAHEPRRGEYDFSGRLDVVRFLELAADYGFVVNLRIGPYACAEWNYGGLPFWLRDIPGMQFRTDNEPFKVEMRRYMEFVVRKLKHHKLFYWQGGPIILTQVENEYGNVEADFGPGGAIYAQWAAEMALSLDTRTPWMMCAQPDTPEEVINTCNGFYCDGWRSNAWSKPNLFTENWSGWFVAWGQSLPDRPTEDLAFSTARWFARGGSYIAYYMYHGGTTFGRYTGGPYLTTSYDYSAPLDEFGLPKEPTYSHLAALHRVIQDCEDALTMSEEPFQAMLGEAQEVHLYGQLLDAWQGAATKSTPCVAFLSNFGGSSETVVFRGREYFLPEWSVSILPDCRNVAFNTAHVKNQTTLMGWTPAIDREGSRHSGAAVVDNWTGKVLRAISTSSTQRLPRASKAWAWKWASEPVGQWGNATSSPLPLEQIVTTRDSTDYLWYIHSLELPEELGPVNVTLEITSVGHALHAFINGDLSGSAIGGAIVTLPISLKGGKNEIAILSMTVGLWNYFAHFETWEAGIRGSVIVRGLPTGDLDVSSTGCWHHQAQSFEECRVALVSGNISSADLVDFDEPKGNRPLAVDLGSMGKGFAWVNGHALGRFWPSMIARPAGAPCDSTCTYQGSYSPAKCRHGCGQPTQRWYHVPREWLRPEDNLLVLFEEMGGDPSLVSLVERTPKTICASLRLGPFATKANRNHNLSVSMVAGNEEEELELSCAPGQEIGALDFVGYADPAAVCGRLDKGDCYAPDTSAKKDAEEQCLGHRRCLIASRRDVFHSGRVRCEGKAKVFVVQARTPDSYMTQ